MQFNSTLNLYNLKEIWVGSSRDLHRFCSVWSSELTSSPFFLKQRAHLNLSDQQCCRESTYCINKQSHYFSISLASNLIKSRVNGYRNSSSLTVLLPLSFIKKTVSSVKLVGHEEMSNLMSWLLSDYFLEKKFSTSVIFSRQSFDLC
jgi:hypothetical protein